MASVLTGYFQLNNGVRMPLIGLGTFCVQDRQTIFYVVEESLKAGYRLFDTAAVYGNEAHIGAALNTLLPKYGLTRADIFLTSKLSPSDQGGGSKTENAVKESIAKLKCNYLDLYLIHWPGAAGVQVSNPENKQLRRNSWESLVRLNKQGLLKAIGVSNYTVRHIEELILDCSGVVPAVNQVEWHPHYYQMDLFDKCKKYGIVVQAYSSLGSSHNISLLNDPTVTNLAQMLQKSPAQILLKWALQHDVGVIPKARSQKHIEDNIKLDFTIPKENMLILDSLNVNNKYAWNPDTVV